MVSMNTKKRLSLYLIIGLCLVVIVGYGMSKSKCDGQNIYFDISLENVVYRVTLENYRLYVENSNTLEKKKLLEDLFIDMVIYDINEDGKEELLLLTLNEEKQGIEGKDFGKELQFYELIVEDKVLMPKLMYTNNIGSVQPFMLRGGRLQENETSIFVGVYKKTRYYEEIINRPFFFSWNGLFIERKWTGSYLSHNELIDLVFVDLTGDGLDEIAVLEETSRGAYQVSLYKWLNFGFDYLTSSKKKDMPLGRLKVTTEKGKAKIKIVYESGREEDVAF